jgi:Tfp pilus assembly protein FimV
MRRPRTNRLSRVAATLLLAVLCHAVVAAELGDATVASYVGQPLVADIELTGLADPAAQVVVRNASMDVYRGANITVSAALSGLALSVVRRDGRQFLHLTTARPVDASYLHLFLELTEGGKQNVRGTTLWLTADPSPPPPPRPVLAQAPVLVAPRPLASAAPAVRPAPVEPEEPPLRKPVREITLGKAPPTCAQVEEQAKACAATEYKNGLLSAQVVELEEKVRQLQLIIDGKAGAGANADASAVAKAAAAAAAPGSAPTPAKPAIPPPPPPKTIKHEPEGGGFPWLLVGGIVIGLAALGGGGFWFLQGRKAAPAEAGDPSASFFARLIGRFKRKNGPVLEVPPEEGSA